MTEEEEQQQQEQEDENKNKRIRPRERARGQKKHEKTHRKLHQVEAKGVQIDVVSQISYDFSQKCP